MGIIRKDANVPRAPRKKSNRKSRKSAAKTKIEQFEFQVGVDVDEDDVEEYEYLYIDTKLTKSQKKTLESNGFEYEDGLGYYIYVEDLGKDLEAAEKKLKKLGKENNFDFTIKEETSDSDEVRKALKKIEDLSRDLSSLQEQLVELLKK